VSVFRVFSNAVEHNRRNFLIEFPVTGQKRNEETARTCEFFQQFADLRFYLRIISLILIDFSDEDLASIDCLLKRRLLLHLSNFLGSRVVVYLEFSDLVPNLEDPATTT